MAVTQYIGARYVPIFADPAEWTNDRTYEPLTIVMHQGNSFTSKQFGIDITNEDFWAETGNYNAQVEAYRNDVERYHNEFGDFREEIEGDVEDINQNIEDFMGATTNTINQFMDDVNVDYFYDEIQLIETGRMDETDYYIVHVPLLDNDGNIIQPTMVYHPTENPLTNAAATGTTLSINGSATIEMTNGDFVQGTVIGNGVVLNEHSFANDPVVSPLVYPLYLCFEEDRTIHEIPVNTNPSAASLLANGYNNVLQCYAKLVSNGVVRPLSDWNPALQINGSTVTDDSHNPTMLMGITEGKDLYFLAGDGRTQLNRGLHYQLAATRLVELGCKNVYMMDGGGSTCMVYRGSKINRNIDNDGTKVRNIRYSLTFNKNTPNETEKKSFGNIGLMRQLTTKQIIQYINENAFAEDALYTISNGTDLNDIYQVGKYRFSGTANTLTNAPFNTTFDLYVMHYGRHDHTVMQLAVSNSYDSDNHWHDQIAVRFVNIFNETNFTPYVSDWQFLSGNHPRKFSLTSNGGSLVYKYNVKNPSIFVAYRCGTGGNNGSLLLEKDHYYEVSKMGNSDITNFFTFDFDPTNRTITFHNSAAAQIWGVICEGDYIY